MTISSRKTILLIAIAASFAEGLLWSGNRTIDGGFVSGAEARVGRPLTPMSYAGVARRTTRRWSGTAPPARSPRAPRGA